MWAVRPWRTLGAVSCAGELPLPFPNPAGDSPLPNHSHIIDGDSFNPIWWQTIAVRVTDERIWLDVNGGCPANPGGEEPCLTSLNSLHAA